MKRDPATFPAIGNVSPRATTLPLDAIRIGERHRKDLGDIDGLARSIADVGLLHPVVVAPDGTLIVGERRVRAAKLLGWTEIPVTVVDLDAVVRGEFAENAVRKDFTLSEAVAIKRALEPREREAAKERQRQRGKTAPRRWAEQADDFCPQVRPCKGTATATGRCPSAEAPTSTCSTRSRITPCRSRRGPTSTCEAASRTDHRRRGGGPSRNTVLSPEESRHSIVAKLSRRPSTDRSINITGAIRGVGVTTEMTMTEEECQEFLSTRREAGKQS